MAVRLIGAPRPAAPAAIGSFVLAVLCLATTCTETAQGSNAYGGIDGDCGAAVGDAMRQECCCAPGSRYWLRGDYILWDLTGSDLPPLVTSSPAGTPSGQAGRLDDSSTTILAGNETVSDDWRSGFALSGGLALDNCGCFAVIGDYFNAGRDSYGFEAGPDSDVILARPFFNTQTGATDAEFVDVPNELDGSVRIAAHDDFQGAGAGLQACLLDGCNPCTGRQTQLSLIGGYRYYQHDSVLAITEDLLVLPGTTTPLVPGTTIDLFDRFSARNEFHGGELGIQGRLRRCECWIDGLAALAVGGNRRTVYVDGSTTTAVPSVGSTASAGGLLTSSQTNIGRYSDTVAAVIPRFRLGAGFQLTEHLAARIGYNVIVWGDVAQAADHLPAGLAVDPRNLPPVQAGGGASPALPGIQDSTIVAHGFDGGVELTF